ncbi:MAG: hypothetical protein JSR44_11130 [Spirochaetes bacterium]|nr:hypothetical protein [Spirochaetota bacterium]
MKLRFNAQILFTGIMLVGFFLPWVTIPGLGSMIDISGYNAPGRLTAIMQMAGERSASGLGYAYLVYLIPALAILIAALNMNNKATHIVSLILGLIPVLPFAYVLVVGASAALQPVAFGAYLTALAGLLLILSAVGVIRFGEETGDGANLAAVFKTHGKKIGIGAGAVVAAILIFLGGRMIYRKVTAPATAFTVASASASSHLPASANYSHEAAKAFDGYRASAWGEGAKGDGIGESIAATFDGTVKIKSIGIINGFTDTHATFGNLYPLNNRVKKAKLIFDDGEETLVFEDGKESEQTIKLASAHSTKSAKLVILEVYKGAKWDDTLVSELAFYDK